MNTARWEHFAHGADVGVRGIGATREEAFEMAALALTAVAVDPELVSPRQAVAIACQAPDEELLLADWLNGVVYEMATRRMVFGRYQVKIDGDSLAGTAWGEPLDRRRHEPAVEIKGATYTALTVRRDNDGQWIAQCVVDV